jgi:hypothetical protein
MASIFFSLNILSSKNIGVISTIKSWPGLLWSIWLNIWWFAGVPDSDSARKPTWTHGRVLTSGLYYRDKSNHIWDPVFFQYIYYIRTLDYVFYNTYGILHSDPKQFSPSFSQIHTLHSGPRQFSDSFSQYVHMLHSDPRKFRPSVFRTKYCSTFGYLDHF